MNDHSTIAVFLNARPGWDKMNAYERTKALCEELTRAGEAIPAWTTIRDLIGKGSSGDINRAKKEFRLEHAEALRKMEGFSAEGVPPSITPLVVGIWREAIGQAQAAFADKTRIWETEVEQADAALQQAQSEFDRISAENQALQARAEGSEQTQAALRSQVQSEQAARAQAEKMLDEIRADLVGQRDRLEAALQHSQAELDKAITRLESSERRYLMEIERARQEAALKIDNANSRLRNEQEKHFLEVTRLNKQVQDDRAQIASLRERNVVLEQQNKATSERAAQAEAAAADLRAQNAKLLAALGAKPGLRERAGRQEKRARRKPARPVRTDRGS